MNIYPVDPPPGAPCQGHYGDNVSDMTYEDGLQPSHLQGKRLVRPIQRIDTTRRCMTDNFYTPPPWFSAAWRMYDQRQHTIRHYCQTMNVPCGRGVAYINTAYQLKQRLTATSDRQSDDDVSSIVPITTGLALRCDPRWSQQQFVDCYTAARDAIVCSKHRDTAVLCLRSACRMWDIPMVCADYSADVWVPSTQRVRRTFNRHGSRFYAPNFVTERYSYHLDTDDTTVIGTTPVTTLERTLVDVLVYFDTPDWIVAGDALLRKLCARDHPHQRPERQSVSAMRDAIRRRCQTLGAVAGKKRALYRLDLLNPVAQSPGESVLRLMAIEMGFSFLQCQARIRLPMMPYPHRRRRPCGLAPQDWIISQQQAGFYFIHIIDTLFSVGLQFDDGGHTHRADGRDYVDSYIGRYLDAFERFTRDDLRRWEVFSSRLQPLFSSSALYNGDQKVA